MILKHSADVCTLQNIERLGNYCTVQKMYLGVSFKYFPLHFSNTIKNDVCVCLFEMTHLTGLVWLTSKFCSGNDTV